MGQEKKENTKKVTLSFSFLTFLFSFINSHLLTTVYWQGASQPGWREPLAKHQWKTNSFAKVG